jgi:hypothetical protein
VFTSNTLPNLTLPLCDIMSGNLTLIWRMSVIRTTLSRDLSNEKFEAIRASCTRFFYLLAVDKYAIVIFLTAVEEFLTYGEEEECIINVNHLEDFRRRIRTKKSIAVK